MEDRPKSFLSLLLKSFLSIKGPLLWFLGFLLTVLFKQLTAEMAISLLWAIPIALVLVLIIITLIKAAYDSYRLSQHGLPKLLIVKEYPLQGGTSAFFCLLEPSDLFSHGILVSFYYDDGNFEVLVGFGMVDHIREDKKIQVRIASAETGHEATMEKLKSNEGEIIKKIKIKPTVPQRQLNLYRQTLLEGGV